MSLISALIGSRVSGKKAAPADGYRRPSGVVNFSAKDKKRSAGHAAGFGRRAGRGGTAYVPQLTGPGAGARAPRAAAAARTAAGGARAAVSNFFNRLRGR